LWNLGKNKENFNSSYTQMRKANYFHLFQEKEKIKQIEKKNNYKKIALIFFLLVIGLFVASIK